MMYGKALFYFLILLSSYFHELALMNDRDRNVHVLIMFNSFKPGVPLWDIGKQHSPRCDTAERGGTSGAILFAWRNFIKKREKVEKSLLTPLK